MKILWPRAFLADSKARRLFFWVYFYLIWRILQIKMHNNCVTLLVCSLNSIYISVSGSQNSFLINVSKSSAKYMLLSAFYFYFLNLFLCISRLSCEIFSQQTYFYLVTYLIILLKCQMVLCRIFIDYGQPIFFWNSR